MEENVTIETKSNARFYLLLSTDKDMQRRLRKAIRQFLSTASKQLQQGARNGLGMKSDPHSAYKAVRSSVYKRVFGGNVNILQRGRGKKTEKAKEYTGRDRGYILRFLNDGVNDRAVKSINGNRIKRTERPNGNRVYMNARIGNRGSIVARHWFGGASQAQLEKAAEALNQMIEEAINDNNI